MKKNILIIFAAILMAACLSACGTKTEAAADNSNKISIVTTIFPEYDWVMNILGDNPAGAEVTMLLDNGVDLHSYQPTAEDIMKISTCDLFIYVGGESDEWVEDALKNTGNNNITAINLLDVLGEKVKEEEIVEGMEGEEEEEGGEEEEEGPEYDEHVWLSLRNASVLAGAISDAIQKIDAPNAETYRKNAEAYKEKLDALDKEYEAAVSGASVNTLLFGDRFPFRYLTDDYNLNYYAAFVGCSAESEASFETITFLAGKVDELSLSSVMTIEGADHKIADTIVRNTQSKGQKILTMDSMQSTTSKDVENGVSYLSVMEGNLEVLKEALK
ncbi:MAG: metal ABC transporter substrate-binding protein [Lachnospiraceae bacterium]|nr:metal ABC transporter substrate-binding protein [Lachnospiraceae bacterium]